MAGCNCLFGRLGALWRTVPVPASRLLLLDLHLPLQTGFEVLEWLQTQSSTGLEGDRVHRHRQPGGKGHGWQLGRGTRFGEDPITSNSSTNSPPCLTCTSSPAQTVRVWSSTHSTFLWPRHRKPAPIHSLGNGRCSRWGFSANNPGDTPRPGKIPSPW